MSKQQVKDFKKRLAIFDDSDEVAGRLIHVDEYAAAEAAVHIEGLWDLAQQLMKYIEEKTNG